MNDKTSKTKESELRSRIKELVAEYYREVKKPEQERSYEPGDRIAYASRVYDEKEMLSLTDAVLDFWLTTGRFADQMEKEFAEWLGVRYVHLVNSGSSANLLAFMALTSPLLGDRQIRRGDEVITVACGFSSFTMATASSTFFASAISVLESTTAPA